MFLFRIFSHSQRQRQQEYNLPEVKDRQFLIAVHKKAKKKGFDVVRYNQLKEEAHDIQSDLRRLNDPLYLRHTPTSSSKFTPFSLTSASTGATTKEQLVDIALNAKNPGELGAKKPLTERLASILATTAQKLKK